MTSGGLSRRSIAACLASALALTTVAMAAAAPVARAATVTCSDPMVFVIDTREIPLDDMTIQLSLDGLDSGWASIDWGGSGVADQDEAAAIGGATGRLQTWASAPGYAAFLYDTVGEHTIKLCGSLNHFGSTGGITRVLSFGRLGVTDYSGAFSFTALTALPDLPPGVTTMVGMFEGSAFNLDISRWDTSQVTDMSFMFAHTSAFNQNIGGWNTSKVTTMWGMFYDAEAFDQDLGGWDVRSIEPFSDPESSMVCMFCYARLSPSNYDALLNGWAAQSVHPGVAFGTDSKYTAAGVAGRTKLISTFGWDIADSGLTSLKKYARTHQPTMSGKARVGKTMTAHVKTWAPKAKISYQWLRSGIAIPGATKSRYALVAADLGAKLSVRAVGARSGYASANRTSKATTVRAGTLTKGRVKITGNRSVGGTLSAKLLSNWTAGVTFTYQWYRNSKQIRGATAATYTPTVNDTGAKIKVRAVAKKAGYTTISATSANVRIR